MKIEKNWLPCFDPILTTFPCWHYFQQTLFSNFLNISIKSPQNKFVFDVFYIVFVWSISDRFWTELNIINSIESIKHWDTTKGQFYWMVSYSFQTRAQLINYIMHKTIDIAVGVKILFRYFYAGKNYIFEEKFTEISI